VYSASPLARAELRDLDVSLRGAVSIARCVIDPLAELVKIDPRSIGVGVYQHDLDDKQLGEALDVVVESAVNAVGVDVNTASPALLLYVAGIGAKLAKAMVIYREENGAFSNRTALRQVKGVGPKAFEQAAGFLRIAGGDEPLDNTAIHPESYGVVRNLFALIGVTGTERDLSARLTEFRKQTTLAEIAQVLNCGEPTLADIFEQLVRPGRDPRDELPKPILRRDVLKLENLKEGMRLKGTVRNVVDFGAFVDIGLKHDGLLHKSQMRRLQRGITVGEVLNVTCDTTELLSSILNFK
jgi:protein Tex